MLKVRMRVRISKSLCFRVATVLIAVLISYLALLCFPQSFFRWSVTSAHLTLYSDSSFAPEEGKTILELVEAKLAASPLFSPQMHHSIFICNARWRRLVLFNRQYRVGGVNYYPLTSNVFLRDSVIGENRLISPSGNAVQGDRTLDYFITHEIAHTITKKAAGWYRHLNLPEYVSEGYPDYVAKGNSFDYENAKEAFLSEAPEMDRWGSGLYLRYHFLVAYLLDKKKKSVQELLENPMEQKSVEDEIRKEESREPGSSMQFAPNHLAESQNSHA